MKLSIAILSSVIAMVSASAVTVTTASTMQVVMDNFAKAQNHFSKINDLVNEFPQNGAKVASVHPVTILLFLRIKIKS